MTGDRVHVRFLRSPLESRSAAFGQNFPFRLAPTFVVAMAFFGSPKRTFTGQVRSVDIAAFFVLGAAISVQPLLFAMARAAVTPPNAGKALAAVNLSFFGGAAVIQALTSPVAVAWGLPAIMGFLGLVLLSATIAFVALTRGR